MEMRNHMRFFCLTILFDDSIQRTNCDDVMSQAKRENRTMATKKAAKKGGKKAAKKKKR